MELVEAVSDLTKLTFTEVYQIGIMEFFAYVSFCKYKAAKREQYEREFKLKHGKN
mgnify:CR=1 FL=1